MKYTVNVSWIVNGSYEIEAPSKDEARDIAWKKGELPHNGEYMEDSFRIDSIETIYEP